MEIELSEIKSVCLEIFNATDIDELKDKIYENVLSNNFEFYERFKTLNVDLSTDFMQKLFQYYQADRKGLKQDYTPKSLAKLVAYLAKDEEIIDMCAGTGALTIQRWNIEPETKFKLYEFDEKVIPFLLFNLAIRNIDAKVYRMNVLSQEVFDVYEVKSKERFSEVVKTK